MVKIPSLEDLKKMSSDLIDSAKTINLGGMVDKLKAGIESVGKKTEAETKVPEDAVQQSLLAIEMAVKELISTQESQVLIVKKIMTNLAKLNSTLAKVAEPISQNEEKKDE